MKALKNILDAEISCLDIAPGSLVSFKKTNFLSCCFISSGEGVEELVPTSWPTETEIFLFVKAETEIGVNGQWTGRIIYSLLSNNKLLFNYSWHRASRIFKIRL